MNELKSIAKTTRTWNCLSCGKCTPVCPPAQAGSGHSPRWLAEAYVGRRKADRKEMLEWCLTCGACQVVCPEGVMTAEMVRRGRAVLPPEEKPVPPPDCWMMAMFLTASKIPGRESSTGMTKQAESWPSSVPAFMRVGELGRKSPSDMRE